MANVQDVANFFIDLANKSEEDTITNLQLNKLLYYAQGHYLARTGKPLFDEPIEAWKYDPVVKSVYQHYKPCYKYPLSMTDNAYNPDTAFTSDEKSLLFDIAREYGKYTPSALVQMTHEQNAPWDKVYAPNKNNIIPLESMQEYFTEHPIKSFDDILKSLPTVTEIPKEWYDPAEDEVWEEYLK